MEFSIKIFCHCPSCVITIRKYHLCPPCCKTGCTGFPLWYYFTIYPQHASLPLDSWIFFHFVSLQHMIFLSPVKSIFEQIITFNCIFFSLSTILASLSDTYSTLTSLCENFKLLSFITHILAIGIRHLRLKLCSQILFFHKNFWDLFSKSFLVLSYALSYIRFGHTIF